MFTTQITNPRGHCDDPNHEPAKSRCNQRGRGMSEMILQLVYLEICDTCSRLRYRQKRSIYALKQVKEGRSSQKLFETIESLNMSYTQAIETILSKLQPQEAVHCCRQKQLRS